MGKFAIIVGVLLGSLYGVQFLRDKSGAKTTESAGSVTVVPPASSAFLVNDGATANLPGYGPANSGGIAPSLRTATSLPGDHMSTSERLGLALG